MKKTAKQHEEIPVEDWRPVVGWENEYEVSNKGRVRSVDRFVKDRIGRIRPIKGQAMRLQHDKDGYNVIGVKKQGKSYIIKVHRAVAEAFIVNDDNKGSIDHINGKRDDNRVENLRFCTTRENANFPLARKNRSESTKQSYVNNPELRNIRAAQFRKNQSKPCEVFCNGESIGIYHSTLAAAKAIGLSQCKANQIAQDGTEYKGYKIVRI